MNQMEHVSQKVDTVTMLHFYYIPDVPHQCTWNTTLTRFMEFFFSKNVRIKGRGSMCKVRQQHVAVDFDRY